MKNLKAVLVTSILVCGSFSAVVFNACTKANCNNVVCKNGGTCSNGVCSCPSGYSGPFCETAATSGIRYRNNTFTPISITVNGDGKVIPVGGTVVFTGKYGTDAVGTATTSGAASSLGISTAGGVIGVPINWAISNSFPTTDTAEYPLDIGATYFFLRVTNKSSKNIINYYVNAGFPYGQTYEDITIPNNSKQYDMGYYLAYPGSNVWTQNTVQVVQKFDVVLPMNSNQVASVVIN